jgi:hypothetical protein
MDKTRRPLGKPFPSSLAVIVVAILILVLSVFLKPSQYLPWVSLYSLFLTFAWLAQRFGNMEQTVELTGEEIREDLKTLREDIERKMEAISQRVADTAAKLESVGGGLEWHPAPPTGRYLEEYRRVARTDQTGEVLHSFQALSKEFPCS